MHEVETMPERLGAFLSNHDGARQATVTAYETITGGYSRLMARADVEWSDGSGESFVLRGDPPPGTGWRSTPWGRMGRPGVMTPARSHACSMNPISPIPEFCGAWPPRR